MTRAPRHPTPAPLPPSTDTPDSPERPRNAALGRFGIIPALPPLFSHKGLVLIRASSSCAAPHSPFQRGWDDRGVHRQCRGGSCWPWNPSLETWTPTPAPAPDTWGDHGPLAIMPRPPPTQPTHGPPKGIERWDRLGTRRWGSGGMWVQPRGCHGHRWIGGIAAAPRLKPPPPGISARFFIN